MSIRYSLDAQQRFARLSQRRAVEYAKVTAPAAKVLNVERRRAERDNHVLKWRSKISAAFIIEDKESRIRERAYRIWEDEGRPIGKDKEHWERARAEVEEEASVTRGDQELKQP